MSQYDAGPNVAAEHGETAFGATRANRAVAPQPGTRPATPADPIGTAPNPDANGASAFSDPADPDRDMDTETVGDTGGY